MGRHAAPLFSDNVRNVAYAIAQARAGQLAADIGAGTGFITEGLLQRGLHVIAIDQSEAMLDAMKVKLAAYTEVDYRVGESERLPINDETVDYVFTNMFLHHVERPATAIREMARVLKAGGKVVLTDLDKHGFEFLKTEQHDRWLGFQRAEIKQWLENAGLRNVRIDDVGEQCCAESACGAHSATISIFVACGEK